MSSTSNSTTGSTSNDVGSHRRGSSSIYALWSTLLPILVLTIVLVSAFLLLRSRQLRIYAPRTYLEVLHDDEKTPPMKNGVFAWVFDFMNLPDDYVLHHQSLDQYLFLRFLKMITIMSLVGCVITWPLLLPVNASGGGGQSQLDSLSISNVKNPNRLYAHTLAAWAFLGFVMLMITRETIYFINLRQAFLLTPLNASRLSSRTVLFTDVPGEYLNERQLRTIFDHVRRIWLATDCSKLANLVKDRDEAVLKLEGAEIKLSTTANNERHKHKTPLTHSDGHDPGIIGSCAAKWIKHNQRPTHRLKPLIGKKVDSINWTRATLPGLIEGVRKAQMTHCHGQKKFLGAVFVEFETQRAAQVAYQLTAHELPLRMEPRCIGVPPSQIIWNNLGMRALKRISNSIWASVFVSAMIIFWSIPVAFVGILSNVDYLTNKVTFLGFINRTPPVILGAIKGLLPTLLLVLLLMVVPILFRRIAKFSGAISKQEVEMKTQSWYFAFQVIQVFLVTTFSSGASAVTTQIIQYPTSTPLLLAQNLPKASNFYISYFVVNGLASASRTLFNAEGILTFGLGKILRKTPRKQYEEYIKLLSLKWGSVYPVWTNFGVIAIAYSCIAPLVLGFAAVGLGLIWLVFKYNSLYTLTTTIDTKGQAYGRALQQLTVGVYLSEICLIGLFAIKIGESAASIGPMFLMILLLIATILFHMVMRRALYRLMHTLPSSLLTRAEETGDAEGGLEEGVVGYSYEGEIQFHSSSDNGSNVSHSIISVEERADGNISETDAIKHIDKEEARLQSVVSGIITRSNEERSRSTAPTTEKRETSTSTMRTAHSELKDLSISHSAKRSAEEDARLRPAPTRNILKNASSPSPPPPSSLPNHSNGLISLLKQFFNPQKYASFSHLQHNLLTSTLLSRQVPPYPAELVRTAYFHPAIASETPVLWIARDEMGISEQEKRHSRKIPGLRVEDEGAWFDEKGMICWDKGGLASSSVVVRDWRGDVLF